MRLTYSLIFGPNISGDLSCQASSGNDIMKSADVGPCPPANHSPPFDRWSSIWEKAIVELSCGPQCFV